MYLKAKYENIKNIGSNLISKSNDIEKTSLEMKKLIDELSLYWKGEDYEEFKSNYLSKISKASISAIELNAIGHAITKVGIVYSLADNDFNDELSIMRKNNYE